MESNKILRSIKNALYWMLARRMSLISEVKLKRSSCCTRVKMSPLVFFKLTNVGSREKMLRFQVSLQGNEQECVYFVRVLLSFPSGSLRKKKKKEKNKQISWWNNWSIGWCQEPKGTEVASPQSDRVSEWSTRSLASLHRSQSEEMTVGGRWSATRQGSFLTPNQANQWISFQYGC